MEYRKNGFEQKKEVGEPIIEDSQEQAEDMEQVGKKI
jgi:hypothetical protein